jgi:hypothetical protein
MHGMPSQSEIVLKIAPDAPKNAKIQLSSENKNVEVKDFVQDLMVKTFLGFISALDDLPESFPKAPIRIEYQVK